MAVVNPVVRRPVLRPSLGLMSHLSSGRFYTNLVLQSINQNNASWSASGLTSRLRNATAPDGVANTATTLLEDSALNNHQIAQNFSPVIATRRILTFSSWFKQGAGTRFPALIVLMNGNGQYTYQSFNLSTGAVANTGIVGNYVVLDKGITKFANNWFRCWFTFLTTNTDTTNSFRVILSDNGTNLSYTGDGTSSMLVWGTQIQTDAKVTNLIRTTTTQITQEETENVYGN